MSKGGAYLGVKISSSFLHLKSALGANYAEYGNYEVDARSLARSFTGTAHSFAFSALLASLVRSAALIHLIARLLIRFRAHGKVHQSNASISYRTFIVGSTQNTPISIFSERLEAILKVYRLVGLALTYTSVFYFTRRSSSLLLWLSIRPR